TGRGCAAPADSHSRRRPTPAPQRFRICGRTRAALRRPSQHLRGGCPREGAGWACEELHEFGRKSGTAEALEWGVAANENPPVLHTHDRYGHRRDEVEFHPAWHNVMRLAVEHRIHSLPWSNPGPGAHVARAALAMLASENESGHVCPISMTYSVVPV